MFDNLPFISKDRKTIEAFLNSNLLDYQGEGLKYCKETGAELRTTYSKYYNLTISIKYNIAKEPIELNSKGSFHYLMNKGKHNADSKSFREVKAFLMEFANTFGIKLKALSLKPSEFGLNVRIPFDASEVVQNLFFEQRKSFIINEPGKPSKISGKPSNDYRLKVYNKFVQFPQYCYPDTLRLEYQAKKMRALQREGISTLNDLLELKNWVKIKEIHFNHFRHLLLYDFTIQLPKNSKYKKDIVNYSNEIKWQNLLKDIRTGIEYNTKYNEELNNLRNISKKYGSNILEVILSLINEQWVNDLELCKNYSHFQIKKLKIAPFFKTKDAPITECNPCTYDKINRLGKTETKEFSYT